MKDGDNRVRVRETSEDAVLLALKIKEEHMSQGMQDAPKAEKGKTKTKTQIPPLELPEGA